MGERMKFYGQARQDEALWYALFQNEPPGYFVDVGAHDGASFSNTLAFEESGWRGVCIEAHPDYIERLTLMRPHSEIVHAAAGPQNLSSVTLYATPFGFLSTVDLSDVATLDSTQGYDSQGRFVAQVPMMTLDVILHGVNAPNNVDLICIDTEGYEVEVLKGLTLSWWRPRILMLEAFDAAHKEKVIQWMAGSGYKLARIIGVDMIYCRYADDSERLEKWQEPTFTPDSR